MVETEHLYRIFVSHKIHQYTHIFYARPCSKNRAVFTYFTCDFIHTQDIIPGAIDVDRVGFPYRMECKTCSKTFSCKSALVRHQKKAGHDPAIKVYECDVCQKVFQHSYKLVRHKTIHTGAKPYQCDVCDKGFRDPSYLVVHKRTHTGDKPYECDVCSKRFVQNSNLKIHKRTHSGEKPYECDICNKKFSRSDNLGVHKRMHTGEKPYECDVCQKRFSTSSGLANHKLTHVGQNQMKLMKVVYVKKVVVFYRKIDTTNKPFECDVCKMRFTKSSDLEIHKRTHIEDTNNDNDVSRPAGTKDNAQKLYECDICKKRYMQPLCNTCKREISWDLGDHATIDDANQMFTDSHCECDICNKQLNDFKSLIEHKATDHNVSHQSDFCNEEQKTAPTDIGYICSLCGSAFDSPRQLERHINTHDIVQNS